MRKDLQEIIYYATKAPSGHNTQPWKFQIKENKVLILPDFDRSLPVVDQDNHALFISLGCATENLVVAANHFGYAADVSILNAQGGIIQVTLVKVNGVTDNKLFHEIEIRQSTRNMYNGEAIPSEHLDILLQAAKQEHVECRIFTAKKEIEPIIELVKEGCVRQFENPAFVDELVHWIRFNRNKAEEKNDGLYSAASGNPNVPEWFGKFIMGIAVTASSEAKKCEDQIKSSSGLAVFIGEKDDIVSWINLGRSFERFALTATSLGIHNAHENMPCEERPVREKFAEWLGLENGEQPLLLVRIGYSQKMPYSNRRPVEEVLTTTEEVISV